MGASKPYRSVVSHTTANSDACAASSSRKRSNTGFSSEFFIDMAAPMMVGFEPMEKKPVEPEPESVDRRSFLAGAATGAAVMLAKQASVAAAQETAPTQARAEPSV